MKFKSYNFSKMAANSDPAAQSSVYLGILFLGCALVFFGLLIWAMPQLLVLLISGAIMLLGFSLIGMALNLRRLQRASSQSSFRQGKTTIVD